MTVSWGTNCVYCHKFKTCQQTLALKQQLPYNVMENDNKNVKIKWIKEKSIEIKKVESARQKLTETIEF